MTDLTINMGGGSFRDRALEIAAAVLACHRWAYAMQARYDRLGACGFQQDATSFQTLLSGLEPDRLHLQLRSR